MECCTPTQVMAGWLLSVLQDNLKINVTSLARFFLILPPFPYYPTIVTIIFFLSLMPVLFPELFLCCDYSIRLSPWALSESGRSQGYGGVFLFHAVSSVPSTVFGTEKAPVITFWITRCVFHRIPWWSLISCEMFLKPCSFPCLCHWAPAVTPGHVYVNS